MTGLAVLAAGAVFGAPAVVLHVDPRGSDAAAGTESRPLRTPEAALVRIAELRRRGEDGDVVVRLRGTFARTTPIRMGAEASRTRWERWGRAAAVFDGGVVLDRWRPTAHLGRPAWEHPVDRPRIRQLWVGGERRPIARLPKSGFYQLAGLKGDAARGRWQDGQTEAVYAEGDLREFANLPDVDFLAHHFWVQSRMTIVGIDPATRTVRFDRGSISRLTDDFTERGAFYRLENVAEGADEPGEWFHDSRRGVIVVLPRAGERIERFRAVIGGATHLLEVDGARDLTLSGLEFRHTEEHLPPGDAGPFQAGFSVPAVLRFADVRRVAVEDCTVRRVGTTAIEFLEGPSQDNAVRRCTLEDLGGGGVKIWHGTRRTTVEDCVIQRAGRVYATGVGVLIGNSGHNRIAHNLIRDLYYTGVSVGWTWGYGDAPTQGNVVEANDIAQIGQGELSDMGGIYTLGDQTGGVVRGNRIRDVEARGYGGWGIYLDEGTRHLLVEGNLVESTKSGGFHQHYGRENVIRHNVFRAARRDGQWIRTRAEPHLSFTLERNVVEWAGTDLLGGDWSGENHRLRNNVYHRTDAPPTFGGRSFADWMATGRDEGSVVGDPGMVVDARGVRFRPGGAAERQGIPGLDLSQVGPRRR